MTSIRAKVVIHHGRLDAIFPVGMAEWLSRKLPDSELTIHEELGHFYREGPASLIQQLASSD